MTKELIAVARAALDYIDAIPPEIAASFPVMPGFDRDWAEEVLAAGVPPEVLEEAAPIDRTYMLDMSAIPRPIEGKGWSGWACQYPGKMPRLYGAKEIAEVNHDPANGDRLFLVVEVEE